MKTSLLKKMCAILIASALYTISAKAQIIYTDVDPDKTIQNLNYYFDLNNDGIADFDLYNKYKTIHCHCYKGTTEGPLEDVLAYSQTSNLIAHFSRSNLIAKLDFNTIIDSFLSWESNIGSKLASNGGHCANCGPTLPHKTYAINGSSGLWGSSTNGYMGLQLKVGLNIYYGWARLDVESWGSSIIFKDYAYNSIPNQPILAGEISCATPTVTLSANGSLSFCVGDSVILTANGSGYLYQWKKDGVNIARAKSQSYVAKTAGIYKCSVTNSCGSKTSKGETVTISCKGLLNTAVTSDEKIISKIVRLNITPNPFSNTTTISFSLPQSQKVSLGIYDITGRLIKVLADKEMQAGTYQLIWDAKDEKGNAVITGIYFLRMNAGNYTETKKISVME